MKDNKKVFKKFMGEENKLFRMLDFVNKFEEKSKIYFAARDKFLGNHLNKSNSSYSFVKANDKSDLVVELVNKTKELAIP